MTSYITLTSSSGDVLGYNSCARTILANSPERLWRRAASGGLQAIIMAPPSMLSLPDSNLNFISKAQIQEVSSNSVYLVYNGQYYDFQNGAIVPVSAPAAFQMQVNIVKPIGLLCGANTSLVGDSCEAQPGNTFCGLNTTWSVTENKCVASAPVNPSSFCGLNTTWSATANKCIAVGPICGANMEWSVEQNKCVVVTLDPNEPVKLQIVSYDPAFKVSLITVFRSVFGTTLSVTKPIFDSFGSYDTIRGLAEKFVADAFIKDPTLITTITPA